MKALSAASLAQAAQRWQLPAPLKLVACTPSTMHDARRLADDGARHGTAVLALEQTSGRGRLARVWEQPTGSVAMTVILRPRLAIADIGRVSLAAAIAMRQTCGERFAVKWPNDVLGPDGRKVAGVLCELETRAGAVEYVLVGIGLNVSSAPRELDSAACLADYDSTPRAVADVAAQLVSELLDAVALAQCDPAALMAQWTQAAATIGRRVSVGGTQGIATGITTSGALIVATDDGAAIVAHSGDVLHIDAKPSGDT